MEEKKKNSNLDDLVRAEKLQLLYHQSYPAIIVSLLGYVLLTAILWPVQQKEVLMSWVFVLTCTVLIRFTLFMLYHRIKPQGSDILAWGMPYLVTLLLSSITWGVGAVYIMPSDSQLHQVVIYFFLLGLSGGAISVYSVTRTLALITIACLMLPITIWFLVQGSLLMIGIAIGAVIFSVSGILAGEILSLKLNKSFMLSHKLKKAKEAAEAMALKDQLSGLNNRRAFYEKGNMLVDYCRRNNDVLSAIIIDIDHFKKINDEYGHAAGDATIKQIGHILRKGMRKSDLSARIGGEEFGILLTTSLADGAAQLAETLRLLIAKTPISYNGKDFSISASFGVAVGNLDLDTLMKRADASLYQAKSAGRNRVICDGRVVEKIQGRLKAK
ncbi:MAG: GGDEF domain-containing protein [Pseudomonadota bacterium]|nr:GGDEF domain-containing protein [Pseudomonadota bacterium]